MTKKLKRVCRKDHIRSTEEGAFRHFRRTDEVGEDPRCGATASVMAAGVIPGAGSTIATGIEIGFVWSMYYRICMKLGVNIKKDLVKSLGSAFITNLAGTIAAQLIAGTALSIVPASAPWAL